MERMTAWKRLSIWALLGLLLSWLISCAAPRPDVEPGASTSASQEIEFWTMQLQPKFTDYFNQLIAEFEAENPEIAVRWVDVPWSDMQSKILSAVAAKTAPDVVNLNPDFASQLAGRNAWLPLDEQISAETQQQYLPNIWQASTLDGSSFGIPWYLTTRVTFYNTDLFQQAGISQPPQTYIELAQVAQQIKDKTGKYAFFVTFVPEDSAEVLQSFVQMGVPLVDAQGRAAFNTAAGKAVFQYWTDLFQAELLPREVLTQGHRRAVDLYQAGETAMLASGPEFLNTIATNAPAIAAVSDTTTQITGTTGKKNVAVMNLVIPRDTDQPDAALQFALFVTNDANQLAFAKAANVLPSTTAALEDSYFTDLPPDASPVAKALSISATQMTAGEVLTPAMAEVKKLQKIIYENLQAAMLGQKTVDQAIAAAETAWNQR
ncbi:MAG: sugar ABC transporter substrate-binding protein [Cyanothece sp. SIO1E1]|nr:sugar ABC transporter substrate-binding protein [Cyanothece sp. SIO1E1]